MSTFLISLMIVLTAAGVFGGEIGKGEKIMQGLSGDENARKQKLIYAVYAPSDEELAHVYFLAESIRQFAGRFSEAPIRVYVPENSKIDRNSWKNKFAGVGVEIRSSNAPKESLWLYFAGKVFAASQAEADAENDAEILVWMDEDTIVLDEPSALLLDDKRGFAYRPVMHNRSGSAFDYPPDKFWSRIYQLLEIDDGLLFPMTTPADQVKIRAYFNAGLLAVRPEHGILRNWATGFMTLYSDPILIEMCKNNVTHKIFLHQTALVGAVKLLDRKQMVELPDSYNYPLFFHHMFEAAREFESLDGISTLRYDVYFRDPDPEWETKLKGDPEKIVWIVDRLGKKE